MQMRVESNGDIVIPERLGRELGFHPGDALAFVGATGRIVLTPQKTTQYVGKIVEDPITGLPVIDFGPDAPILTNEQVEEMLADFP
jgi:bifunctional DNA-binding transcriptional regulator/antitoxin component of YhaV-PrlF toxin-antitoxin module